VTTLKFEECPIFVRTPYLAVKFLNEHINQLLAVPHGCILVGAIKGLLPLVEKREKVKPANGWYPLVTPEAYARYVTDRMEDIPFLSEHYWAVKVLLETVIEKEWFLVKEKASEPLKEKKMVTFSNESFLSFQKTVSDLLMETAGVDSKKVNVLSVRLTLDGCIKEVVWEKNDCQFKITHRNDVRGYTLTAYTLNAD